MFVKCGAPVAGMFPGRTRRIEASVIYCFFGRAPRKFDTAQALIFFFGPAEVQSFSASLGQILYCFKHGQVIGAKLLEPFIRSAKFIDRVAPQFKKHGGRDGAFLAFDENNKPQTGANQMPLNIYKKRSRLRWRSMAAAGADMQLVKLSHRIRARLNTYS